MSGPSDAQKQVEEFDRLLKAQDVGATKRLVDSYQGVSAQLVRDTEALTKIAQTQGLKPWQVMRMQRYRELQAQYIQNFDRYAEAAGGVISDHQREAVNLARRGSEATVIAGLPPGITMDNMTNMGLGWNRLPDEAYRNFIGISANGAPVAELLRPLGPDAAMGIRQAIGNGIALGYGPRKVARQVADKSGMALSRSLLISRTEITRAHREASRLDYQNNKQLVKGYKRVATKSDSTCVACIDGAGRLGLCRPWPGCGAITRTPDSKGLAGEPTGDRPAQDTEEGPLRCLEEGRHPTEPTGDGQAEPGVGRFRRGQTVKRPGDRKATTPTT